MRPSVNLPPPVKYCFPVGALQDIPTGTYIIGTHGQYVLLGGLSSITGYIGPGNTFKTTVMRYAVLSAIARNYYAFKDECYYMSYDTEVNNHESRNYKLTQNYPTLQGINILEEGLWQITDKTVYPGEKCWSTIKDYLHEKLDRKNKTLYETAFVGRDLKSPMKVMCPTFNDIDSISQFITSDVEKTLEDVELGHKDGNTVFMRQGLAKAKMLMEMPTVAGTYFNFFSFTAHVGKDIPIASGPGSPPPKKQLQHLDQGVVIKGVTNNFLYLLHNLWYITSARPELNANTKAPEYPYEPGDEEPGDLDLNVVTMKQLRGKNGGSGFAIKLYVSQREGVLSYLTDFVYCKEHQKYGIEGNDRNYALSLRPDVALSRTTVRKKLRDCKLMRRAAEITSELCQIEIFHPDLRKKVVRPAELYKKLIELGYDWDFILSETRSYHCLNDEEYPGYPLSTIDLCRIATGDYHPYWLEKDCKTIKPEYKAKKMVIPAVTAG